MSSGLAKAIIKKGLFILNWVVRIALIILYVALASGRGWIALLFLCMVSLDIAVKKGWYIVLDISLAVFFILSLLPRFITRDLTNTAHFYMLQDRYECVAEECMKLDVDDFVHITEPQYKIEKK